MELRDFQGLKSNAEFAAFLLDNQCRQIKIIHDSSQMLQTKEMSLVWKCEEEKI